MMSNILSMSWQNLNLTTGIWTIPAELWKNKENQHIVLTEVELETLQRRLRDQGGKSIFVFEQRKDGSCYRREEGME